MLNSADKDFKASIINCKRIFKIIFKELKGKYDHYDTIDREYR